MKKPFKLTFSNRQTACAVQVDEFVDLPVALGEIGLHGPRPILVLVGGASKLSEADLIRLRLIFVEVLAPLAEELNAFVVDGGTDAGVMKMMGQSRHEIKATFPLIGIAPLGIITLPDSTPTSPDAAMLEPHHTHFILVPGSKWGDESPWQAQVASVLADQAPSVTLLINGGAIALVDVMENVKAGRPIIVIAGSGRLADEIANALTHPDVEAREDVAVVLRESQLTLFDFSKPIAELVELVREFLTGKRSR